MSKDPYRFYTYAYLREDKTPYYIGKGTGKRICDKSGKPCGKPKDKSRIIFLKQNITEEEAFKHEIYMIAVFGRIDLGTGILYNKTDGGDGTCGRIVSEETRKKLSKINKNKKVSEETKRKISNTTKGKKVSEETKEKIRMSRIGTKRGEETKKKLKKIAKNRSVETIEKIRQSKCKRQYKLINKEGKIYIIKNLKLFCDQYDLNSGAIYQLVNKKIDYYKGWTGCIIDNQEVPV